MNNIHFIAATISSKVMSGKNLDKLFIEYFENQENTLSENDKRQIKAITFDTLRNFKTLIFFLNSLIKKEIENKQIMFLILIGLNQLTYGNKKNYAIVNEIVNLAKKIDIRQSGFVNAILRNFLRQKESLIKKLNLNLETKFNFDNWWIQKLKDKYPNNWENILNSMNNHPPMTLRVNKTRISLKNYKQILISNKIDFLELKDYTIVLKKPLRVEEISGFQEGFISIQDYGAQIAVDLLDVKNGLNILDACSAPGGKTGSILENFKVNLTAIDASLSRVSKVNENLARLGLVANVMNESLTKKNEWWNKKKFDRILLDVPCSGSGVIKRNIDIKWLRKKDDFNKFQKEQINLLNYAWPLLKKNGKLLYITCSIFEEENSQVISSFMKKQKDVKILKLDFPKNIERIGNQILPNNYHDGFYYELLEKI